MAILLNLIRVAFTRLWPFLIALLTSGVKSGAKWGLALSVAGLLGYTDSGKEVLLWAFDQLLTVFGYILGLIILPAALTNWTMQSAFLGISSNFAMVIGYVGFSQALVLITAAYGVRLLRDILKF